MKHAWVSVGNYRVIQFSNRTVKKIGVAAVGLIPEVNKCEGWLRYLTKKRQTDTKEMFQQVCVSEQTKSNTEYLVEERSILIHKRLSKHHSEIVKAKETIPYFCCCCNFQITTCELGYFCFQRSILVYICNYQKEKHHSVVMSWEKRWRGT